MQVDLSQLDEPALEITKEKEKLKNEKFKGK